MTTPSRERRLIDGVWQYVTAQEGGAGSLPSGGSTGEVLTKASNADGDADWEPGGGTVPDLAQVLTEGSDGGSAGMSNTGEVSTGGGGVNTSGGDMDANGGTVKALNVLFREADSFDNIGTIVADTDHLKVTGNAPTVIEGGLDMADYPIENVADPTTDQQAATKKYVDDSGGSTLSLRGPYHVDFTDIPNDQDDVELWTPAVGEIVLVCSINPRTAVAPAGDFSSVMLIGQASELPNSGGGFEGAFWAGMDTDIVTDSVNGAAVIQGRNYPDDVLPGYQVRVAPIFPLAEPVVCRNNSGGDLTGGAIDVYFLVTTATAP